MERMGRIPICIQGVQFHFLSSSDGPSRNNGKNNNNNSANNNFPGPPIRDLQAAASSSSPTMNGDQPISHNIHRNATVTKLDPYPVVPPLLFLYSQVTNLSPVVS